MKHLNIKQLFVAAALLTTGLYACKKDKSDPTPVDPVSGKYENGFFIIGEGAIGQNSGALNFYRYGDDTVGIRVYERENPGKILSNSAKSSTLQFASVFNGSIYLMCKMNGPIVKVNEITLKEEARYVQEATTNWRSIVQVEGNRGLVSAADGVYQIDLNTLAVQNKLTTIGTSNTGDMWKKGDYVYLLRSNGATIISAGNYSFVKSFSNINRGFAQTPNGKIWASTGTRLIAINDKLDTAGVPLKVSIGTFSLDAPTRITASTKENAVFYHSGKAIYKYIDGNVSSLAEPFITITENPFMVYGAIRYDKNKDYIVVNGIQNYGAESTVNYLLIYNASTGALIKRIKYGGDGITTDFTKIYFPNLTVFH